MEVIKRKIDYLFGIHKLQEDLAISIKESNAINDYSWIKNGDLFNVKLSGPNEGVFEFEACYIGKHPKGLEICLLSRDDMGVYDFPTQTSLRWNYELVLNDKKFKGTCGVPTSSQIRHKCHNPARDEDYFMLDTNKVNHDGFIILTCFSDAIVPKSSTFPFITLLIKDE